MRNSLTILARRARLLALLLVCATLATRSAHAQASSARACLDAIPDSALMPEVVYLVPEVHDTKHEVRPVTLSSFDLLAQSIAERMRLPDDSATHAHHGVPDSLTWRELSGDVLVTVRRSGGFVARELPDSSDDGFATGRRGAALILRAASLVAQAAEPFLWDEEQEGDSLAFRLSLTVPTHGRDGVMRKIESRVAIPVFIVRTPWSEQVTQLPGAAGRLKYPDEPRHRGYQADIHVRFIVDTTGHADASTIRDYIPDGQTRPRGEDARMYDMFVREVRRAIPTMQFTPASVAGCVIRMRVQQPFTFSLTR